VVENMVDMHEALGLIFIPCPSKEFKYKNGKGRKYFYYVIMGCKSPSILIFCKMNI
jgi:hypothetical protein